MKFRTPLELPHFGFRLHHADAVVALGSCFAECLPRYLRYYKMPVLANPLGILYHPLALARLLEGRWNPNHLLQREGYYFSLDAHSSIHSTTEDGLLRAMNRAHQQLWQALRSSRLLILTFGTAWAWRYLATEEVVANCQKLPQKNFRKSLEPAETMHSGLGSSLEAVLRENPHLQILLTLSPVRHLREGLANNQLSKSLLRVLCADLSKEQSRIHYFPAYEMLMDDLRDYRFYADDLLHPNAQAEQYVWEHFQESLFTPEARSQMQRVEKAQKLLQHRPLLPEKRSQHWQLILKYLKEHQLEDLFRREIETIKSSG